MAELERAPRPILFSGAMVLKIFQRLKWQTRRVLGEAYAHLEPELWEAAAPGTWRAWDHIRNETIHFGSPYGQPGDRLWVRERMRCIGRGPLTRKADTIRVRYEADGAESGLLPYPAHLKWDPVIGKCLPYGGHREASRLQLGVLGVRVERLQDINDADAIAEGAAPGCDDGSFPKVRADGIGARAWFQTLWDSINGKRPGASWKDNPWVWAIEFDFAGNVAR